MLSHTAASSRTDRGVIVDVKSSAAMRLEYASIIDPHMSLSETLAVRLRFSVQLNSTLASIVADSVWTCIPSVVILPVLEISTEA
jgi:hypothetical protein